MAFLIQEVLFEPPKKRGRKSKEQKIIEDNSRMDRWNSMQNRENVLPPIDDVDLSNVKVGIKTLQGYVTAICDLYQFQNQFESNNSVHPRSKQVKKLIDSVGKLNMKQKDESFADRLKNTATDIISVSNYIRNAKYVALKELKNQATGIADRVDILMLYSLMARSQITRGLRLSEVGVEEVSPYAPNLLALRFTINKSKTNQFQRVLSVGLLR